MLIISYSSEYFDERTWHLTIGHVWEIPFLAYMVQMNLHRSNRWTYWACSTLLIAHPNAGPLLHGWVSRNSNAVRTRAVGAAVFSMFFQLSGIVSANIYQKGEWSMRLIPSVAIDLVDIDELPNFHTGNKILLGIAILNTQRIFTPEVWPSSQTRQINTYQFSTSQASTDFQDCDFTDFVECGFAETFVFHRTKSPLL